MMAGDTAGGDYKDVVLFLATAGVVVPILRRWKISPVLGFLAAGVLLGPFGLGALHQSLPWLSYLTIESPSQVAHLAELGVVFLLFMIGLELSWDRLWTMRRLVFGLGGLQVIACATAIAVIAALLGHGAVSATVLGMALALSSTAIVMPLLAEQKRQHSMARPRDLLGPAAAGPGGGPDPRDDRVSGKSSGQRFLFQAPHGISTGRARLAGPGRPRSPRAAPDDEICRPGRQPGAVHGRLSSGGDRCGAGSRDGRTVDGPGRFHCRPAAGRDGTSQADRKDGRTVQGLLLGLFFVSVGISLDLSRLAAAPALIVGLMVGVMTLNGAIVFGLARLWRLRRAAALETALLLAAGGEFSFVVLQSAMTEKLLDRTLGQTILVASTLSMFAIPMLAAISAAVRERVLAANPTASAPSVQHRET